MLKNISRYLTGSKVNRAISAIMEEGDTDFKDCDELACMIEEAMHKIGVPTGRVSVIPKPENADLGHVCGQRMGRHEVVEIMGKIYDLRYNGKPLPLERYLKEAYRPADGVKVEVL